MTPQSTFSIPVDDPTSPLTQNLQGVNRADVLARAALASSPVVDLRELSVEQQGETLMISGKVHCFYHKQLAQETVRPHAANLRMVNDVSVEQ